MSVFYMAYSPDLRLLSCSGHVLSSASSITSYENYITAKSLLKHSQSDLASSVNPPLTQGHFLSCTDR